ncbi:hypothetical protein [Crenothrix sp.]|uniref:hypothetical protein n=1 Tax=Crenothrix sp. TaxID=3100433 RepID=UPI00374CE7AA
MNKVVIMLILNALSTGCATNTAQSPKRPGIYGPVAYVVVVSEEKMLSKNRLSPQARQELITAKAQADKEGGAIHVICPESSTQEVMSEMNKLGIIYDRDIRLHNGYLIIFPKKNSL